MRNRSHNADDQSTEKVRSPRGDDPQASPHNASMQTGRSIWFMRDWRKFRGLSLEALAGRMESSKGYMGDLETGKRRYNQDVLEMLAEVLQCTPADLLRRRPDDPESIETNGLTPDQLKLVRDTVDQFRKTG